MSRSRNMIIDRKFVWYRMEKMTKIVLLIDHIQQWKMQVIWNQFHRQNCLILKRFSNFEARAPWNGRETDLVFPENFDVVWGLFLCKLTTQSIETYGKIILVLVQLVPADCDVNQKSEPIWVLLVQRAEP